MIFDNKVNFEKEWPRHLQRETARSHIADLIDDPEVAQVVWNELIAPLYDVLAARAVYSGRMRCRICSRPHPTSPTGRAWAAKGKHDPGHAMWCANYVGPLEHRQDRTQRTLGGSQWLCTCGASYPDKDGARCPDADVWWRGPSAPLW